MAKPNWMGSLHDTTTILLPRNKFVGDFITERDGIGFYILSEPVGPLPVGYVVGTAARVGENAE